MPQTHSFSAAFARITAVLTMPSIPLQVFSCALPVRILCEQIVDEEPGKVKITPAYNLPCDYVFHTVGPIVKGCVTKEDEKLLASCYRSCLELAVLSRINSIAFCCISTGEFHFPNDRAAEIAIQTVTEFVAQKQSEIKVIFMFSKIWTTKSTKSCSEQISRLKESIRSADAIVIGAGAGLSTSAGFVYTGERFHEYFSDFEKK